MATSIHLIRRCDGALYPATDADTDVLRRVKAGELIKATFTKPRNPRFHRLFFALVQIAFDAWEVPGGTKHAGMLVQKNLDQFRKDLIIAAGYYDVTCNIQGTIRAEARSMSFASMDETEFHELYSKVADVILQQILTNYSRSDLDEQVNRVLGMV